jgi:hypothetical protein
MRWKEVVGGVEGVFGGSPSSFSFSPSSSSLASSGGRGGERGGGVGAGERGKDKGEGKADGGFVMPQTEVVWNAIERCWSAEVYIPELGYRFWRLTLQVSWFGFFCWFGFLVWWGFWFCFVWVIFISGFYFIVLSRYDGCCDRN